MSNFFDKIFSIKQTDGNRHDVIRLFGFKISKKTKNKKSDYKKFVDFIENNTQKNFIPFCEHEQKNFDVKPIAFYLPQYYTFKENDSWHGKGFTEWTNVAQARPLYQGHYQPHIPYDVGFYTLNSDIFKRQIELAKNYGIHGFSFYYYWFQGKKIMEKPLYEYLHNKNLNFPFCLCWACENWSKLWDGGNKEILLESKLEENDIENFWHDILPFFEDERYIKIDGRPLLILYKPLVLDEAILKRFVAKIKEFASNTEFKDIYILTVLSPDIINMSDEKFNQFNFDGCCEFPPHGLTQNRDSYRNVICKKVYGYISKYLKGQIFDIAEYIKNQRYNKISNPTRNIFRACFPSWDNSARKARSGCFIFDGETSDLYKTWLKDIISWTLNNKRKNERFVFINAWNEWAEGAHLEPDLKHGYAYLQATYEALCESNKKRDC